MFTGDQCAVRINMNEFRTHQREFKDLKLRVLSLIGRMMRRSDAVESQLQALSLAVHFGGGNQ
jgi:hypothetical protein